MNGFNGSGEDASQETVPKPSLRLGFAEYCRISNLIVLHLRKMEEGEMYPTLFICCSRHFRCCVLSEVRRGDRSLRLAHFRKETWVGLA